MLAWKIIAVALAGLGQFSDAYTTYIGVWVKKTKVEAGCCGAKWLAANPLRLLTLKPIGLTAYLALCFPWAHGNWLVVSFVLAGVLAVSGFRAGYANWRANG